MFKKKAKFVHIFISLNQFGPYNGNNLDNRCKKNIHILGKTLSVDNYCYLLWSDN